MLLLPMFLRSTNRKKDGKNHRYFSIVENRRLLGGKTVQRTVLYLGEINDQQQAEWRKTLYVFDEDEQRYTTMSLFPDDREVPADALDSVQVKLSGLELRRPRVFGNCWLACELWRHLGLDEFWQQCLAEARETVSWEKVLRLLVVNRLLDPGSEFRVHRQWFVDSAMDELLETDFAVAEKDRLYRCLDRVLEHKQELFVWLKQKWADLFGAEFDVLLYDLTSTYFEGKMEQNPKAKRGYSRDKRGDWLQLVIALVVTPDGFPLAYEVMNGNTSDRTTLRDFLQKIENTYGKAQRVWVMDRGIPTEAILQEMREPQRQTFYLVGNQLTHTSSGQNIQVRVLRLSWMFLMPENEWARLLAYVTGLINQKLLFQNEYLAAENRFFRAHLPARVRLSDPERSTLAEIAKRLGRTALQQVACVAKPDTILAWYRRLIARKFDGSKLRVSPGRPRIAPDLEALIVRFDRENSGWGYDRIVGALANLGRSSDGGQHPSPIRHPAGTQAEPEYNLEGFHRLPYGGPDRYLLLHR